MQDATQPNSNELLIRIDERQKAMTESMLRIENAILTKVENNQEYQVLLAQNKTMWDLKNKATGYIAAWAAAVSVATYLLAGFIQGIFTAK